MKTYEVEAFNKIVLGKIRDAMETALKAVAEEFDIGIKVGNATYSATNSTFKVELSVKENGEVITREAKEFTQLAYLYGLEPSDLGRKFLTSGGSYEIVGLSSKSYKRPILAKRDGRVYKFPADAIKTALFKTSKANPANR